MKKGLITLLVILSCSLLVHGQADSSKNNEEKTDSAVFFLTSETLPEFKGGQNALQLFLRDNIKYPKKALKNKTEGMVLVMFTINENGSVDNVIVISRPNGDGLEEEAIRVVQLTSNKWIPATQMGKKVKVRQTLPINFQLN